MQADKLNTIFIIDFFCAHQDMTNYAYFAKLTNYSSDTMTTYVYSQDKHFFL